MGTVGKASGPYYISQCVDTLHLEVLGLNWFNALRFITGLLLWN